MCLNCVAAKYSGQNLFSQSAFNLVAKIISIRVELFIKSVTDSKLKRINLFLCFFLRPFRVAASFNFVAISVNIDRYKLVKRN